MTSREGRGREKDGRIEREGGRGTEEKQEGETDKERESERERENKKTGIKGSLNERREGGRNREIRKK